MAMREGPFDYINRYYGLSLKPGTRLVYTTESGVRRHGQIVRTKPSDRAHVMVRFDGTERIDGPFHPTWNMEYSCWPLARLS